MPKNESRERCIYSTVDNLCDGTHPLHEKEHYLPAGLGEFANDKRLRNKICFRCQKDFGGLEDVFLHNSPEAFFRFLIGQRGRKREKKKNIFYEPTAKRPPLTITAKQPGEEYTVLWEMISQKEAKPMNQMVFRDGHGEYHHLPYRPGEVSSEQVLEFVNNNKIAKPELISYFFDNEESANQIELACKDYMKGKSKEGKLSGGNVECEMKAEITVPYLRALAKIAFHFVLAHFPFTGFEPEFDNIKRFIFWGHENYADFVQQTQEQFIFDLQNPEAIMNNWSHFLSAEYDYNLIQVRMQFFAAPLLRPIIWKVVLGRSPSRVIGRNGKCYWYRYYDQRDAQGHSGFMKELQPS